MGNRNKNTDWLERKKGVIKRTKRALTGSISSEEYNAKKGKERKRIKEDLKREYRAAKRAEKSNIDSKIRDFLSNGDDTIFD